MIALMTAAVAFGACDGPGITENECAARFACQVEGVDLAVVSVTVDSTAPHYSGVVLVDPSSVTIRFVVVNRGDRTSSSDVSVEAGVYGVKQTVALSPIAPGDSAIGVAQLSIGRAYLMAGDDLESENAIVRLLTPDAAPDNNTLAGPRVVLTIPFFSLEPVIMPPQTVRIGDRITIWFNYEFGWLSGSHDGVNVLVCLRTADRTCTEGNWRPILLFDNLTGGGRFTEFPLSAEAAPSPAAGEYQIIYCAVPTAYRGVYLRPASVNHRCRAAGTVTVVP